MGYDEAGDDWNSDYPTMSDQRIEWKAGGAQDAHGLKFAILVSRFNSDVTCKLLEGAREALKQAHAEPADEFFVPGAFELAFAAKRLIGDCGRFHGSNYAGIIALGAVIRGETPHFDYVCAESARGLQQVALETGIPIAFGVLTTNTMDQALARAGGAAGNKGFDAAMTAVEMARFARQE
jgi:6,7-dimethyl-8-ribityllumazine synthase